MADAPWTPDDQRRHRQVLQSAIDQDPEDDPDWAQLADRYLPDGPVERPPTPLQRRPPRGPSPPAGDRDQRPGRLCPACRTRNHGVNCEAARCACRCRVTLGLEGPFPGGDPDAPFWLDGAGGVAADL